MYFLDHVVHFVEDPENVRQQMIERGFHAVKGGQHEQWGTYNTLCYFGLTYVEWIAIDDLDKFKEAAKEPYTLHATYEKNGRRNGLTRLAIRTTTIEEDAKMFERAGFTVNGPARFSRQRPDGSTVSWQLLYVGRADQQFDFPFFIQWDVEDETRLEQYKELDIIKEHNKGQLELSEIVYFVKRLDYLKTLQKLGQFHYEETVEEQLNAVKYTLFLENGKITCYCPLGEGEIWDAILADGLGLHAVVLEGLNQKETFVCENGIYIIQ